MYQSGVEKDFKSDDPFETFCGFLKRYNKIIKESLLILFIFCFRTGAWQDFYTIYFQILPILVSSMI